MTDGQLLALAILLVVCAPLWLGAVLLLVWMWIAMLRHLGVPLPWVLVDLYDFGNTHDYTWRQYRKIRKERRKR